MKRVLFKDIPVGSKFLFNSLTCVKRSTKTADCLINEKLGHYKRFYFGQKDAVKIVN